MGIDDILKKKQEREAQARQDAAEAPGKAQALRNEAYAGITAALVSAIKDIGDDALGDPEVVSITDVPGGTRRTIQVKCEGRLHTIFKTAVECAPGDAVPNYDPIEVIVSTGARSLSELVGRRGPWQPKISTIYSDDLKTALYRVVGKL